METFTYTGFIKNEADLFDSVREFNLKPEFWKPILSTAPKYFLHTRVNNFHYFGLSKFCLFKNISAEEYITTYRYRTDGGYAQNAISNCCRRPWVSYTNSSASLQSAFAAWIHDFFPAYDLKKANFITIAAPAESERKKRAITPEKLREALELKSTIGEIGEEIAVRFEMERLANKGIRKPKEYVFHVSKKNTTSGYDIFTNARKDNRYIEVKSSLNNASEFYITENEYSTLEQLGEQAYIYRVVISDLRTAKGEVVEIIRNPVQELKKRGILTPIAFRVTLQP